MGRLNDVDKAYLYYHQINYMVEAYNIFYGMYPTFSTYEEELKLKKDFQLMLLVLGEYDILNSQYSDYRYLNFDQETEIAYSFMVEIMTDLFINKFRKNNNQEEDLELLCSERPLEAKQQEGIKAVSFVIKKQMEKENIEDYNEFLSQLVNIIYYRNESISIENNYAEKIEKIINIVINRCYNLDYTYDMIKEKLKFICQNLHLNLDIICAKCDIQNVVEDVKDIGEYSIYRGINRSHQKLKVLELD